ncbi:hypothetical protein L6164_026984 [Bauhinia variegata]|uniref:Uncharacterized protein n=1 Tax=Bauhinia variegata TaxID=167791 RepID=A0ACB9LRR9_BAUVA|nr:hypothetical protein L6164_026984 [Bauhinia variegata]
MDYLKHTKLSHGSSGIIKFLLSISLFSFLLQFSKPFLVQLSSYSIAKSYMFLLCNGLVGFIVKSSGLIDGFSPTHNQSKEPAVDNPESGRSELKVSDKNGVKTEYPEEEKEGKKLVTEGEEEEEEERNGFLISGEGDHDEEMTEELNKKCEDFIRKMKEAFTKI